MSIQLPARVVAILGMHRSGTSCLTGSLQEAGLALGDCHTWSRHNLKGNRENQDFVDLHDAILAANGGAWDDPPARVAWNSEHNARALGLLEQHAFEPLFGFKDPRTLLVVQGWKQLVPEIEFVGIFRHPNAVAASLGKRSGMPRAEALKLWYAYNSALYQQYKKRYFPILSFDDDETVLDEKILHVVGEMGLDGRAGEEKFYSSELKTNVDAGSQSLPWRVRRLFKKLNKISR